MKVISTSFLVLRLPHGFLERRECFSDRCEGDVACASQAESSGEYSYLEPVETGSDNFSTAPPGETIVIRQEGLCPPHLSEEPCR